MKMCCETCVNSSDAKWIRIYLAFLTLSFLVKSKCNFLYIAPQARQNAKISREKNSRKLLSFLSQRNQDNSNFYKKF